LNFARTLAEPNLVTINGQPASFLAGGEFPVPVTTGITLTGLQGVQYVPFGVQLRFIPYVTDKDRVRLIVSSNVTTRDVATGTTIGTTSSVPGLNSRFFQTTVELRDGQTIAVAGLIQNSYGATAARVPFFGDLPFVGNLFALNGSSSNEQELVVLITPMLVYPYDPHQVPPLPGSDIFEPGDLEFYLLGRLEGRRSYDYRAGARTDIHRMLRYRRCDDIFISGPHGHSPGPH
jgi:pilus assembly protein CpaC